MGISCPPTWRLEDNPWYIANKWARRKGSWCPASHRRQRQYPVPLCLRKCIGKRHRTGPACSPSYSSRCPSANPRAVLRFPICARACTTVMRWETSTRPCLSRRWPCKVFLQRLLPGCQSPCIRLGARGLHRRARHTSHLPVRGLMWSSYSRRQRK